MAKRKSRAKRSSPVGNGGPNYGSMSGPDMLRNAAAMHGRGLPQYERAKVMAPRMRGGRRA